MEGGASPTWGTYLKKEISKPDGGAGRTRVAMEGPDGKMEERRKGETSPYREGRASPMLLRWWMTSPRAGGEEEVLGEAGLG